MLLLEIPITQDDIDNGQQRNYSMCPLALALNRITGQEVSVHYNLFLVYTSKREDQWCEFRLDSMAKDFVHAFDAGDVVHPTTVTATLSP